MDKLNIVHISEKNISERQSGIIKRKCSIILDQNLRILQSRIKVYLLVFRIFYKVVNPID